MGLLDCIDIRKDYAGTPVLEGADLSVREGERVALVGRNGCGKSTLLAIAAGFDDDFKGTVRVEGGAKMGFVAQYPAFPPGLTAQGILTADALALREELARMEEAMAEGDCGSLALARYAELGERYAALSGDGAESRAERLLSQAGLARSRDTEAACLSGGEKNVLSLLLAARDGPGLLVLDEPGNHLDFAGLAWLEEFIQSYRGAVLFVSHDRRLIDRTATRVVELERGKAASYPGNYSSYRLEKLKKAQAQGAGHDADRKRVESLEALVRRFADIARSRPDPAWGKRLRAKRSLLERVRSEARERPETGMTAMRVSLAGEASKADVALSVEGYSREVGGRVLLRDASLLLLSGERAALVGANGTGKTTLLRDIVSRGAWDSPDLRVGPSMRIGYCAQNQEVFDRADTVEAAFSRLGLTASETFKLLSRYQFARADLPRAVGSLSGGELNRLQVARAECLKANFLVLDEPTNHLDIPSREALEEGLEGFGGTILVVSHDRYFLDKVADRVAFLEEGAIAEYEGSFEEWWRDVGAPAARAARERSRGGSVSARGKGMEAGRGSSPSKPGNGTAAKVEERILALEAEKEGIEARMEAAVREGDWSQSRSLSAKADRLAAVIARLYEEL